MTGDIMSWGSDVEMPQPGETIQAPRPPPTINIQAPTDSNLGKSQRTRSHTVRSGSSVRYPPKTQSQQASANKVVAADISRLDPQERDLPPPPSESLLSNPGSAVKRANTRQSVKPNRHEPIPVDERHNQSVYETAAMEPNNHAVSAIRDKLHIIDPINPKIVEPAPWNLITQRLYSWALVWEDETFIRALERISLGQQVRSA